MPKFAELFRRRRPERTRLAQYVGDGTILIYGQDEIFVYVDGRDASLTPCLLRDDAWEPALTDYLTQSLKPGDCFVDIGANNGIHSLRVARRVGASGLVVAFEPQRRMFDLLQRSIAANIMMRTLHVRQKAISDTAGTGRLGKFQNFAGSATITDNPMIVEHEEVEVAPLAEALAKVSEEIGRTVEPDLIKIDVEGYEYHVWNGMKEWTRARPKLTIAIEFSPVSYRAMGQDPGALLREFQEYEFSVSRLLPRGSTSRCSPEELEAMPLSDQQFDLILVK